MSLGDGLAHALKRYTRAKERHGLKALLLCEIDPAEIDRDYTQSRSNGSNGGNGGGTSDITVEAAARLAESKPTPLPARLSYRLKCPECGGDLDTGENCTKCHSCGYAQC
jgi:hypothetical protein